jgi:hypothetical protein
MSENQLPESVYVPRVSASRLVAKAKSELAKKEGEVFISSDITFWIRRDLQRVRGRTLRVVSSRFSYPWTNRDARAKQSRDRLNGNVAALLILAMTTDIVGSFGTLQNEPGPSFFGRLLLGDWDGRFRLCPYFTREYGRFSFGLSDERILDGTGWSADSALISFTE